MDIAHLALQEEVTTTDGAEDVEELMDWIFGEDDIGSDEGNEEETDSDDGDSIRELS